MKFLILLVLTSCAFSQPYDYQEYVIEQTSNDLRGSIARFEISLRELEQSVCRDHFDYVKANCKKKNIKDELQGKICEEYKTPPDFCNKWNK